jgi:hypothetical protein
MSDPVPTTPRGWRPSRRTGLVAGGAAVLALAVAVAVGLGAGDRDDPDAGTPAGATPSATTGPRTPSAPAPSAGSDATPGPDDTGTPTAEPTTGPAPGADAPGPAPDDAPAPTAVPELPPVPLTDGSSGTAEFGTEVAARLAGVARVDGQGQGLGEDSGPALAVTVQMDNGTAEPLDLSFVAVTLLDDAGNPGQVLLGDPRSAPFTGPLAPGGTAEATYVLRLPDPGTTGVTVTVSYGAEAPTAVFTGPVPAAAG